MAVVELRAMTPDEYADYHGHSVRTYAEQMAEMGGVEASIAWADSERTMRELLPDGLATEGQHLLVAESAGERVGIVWVGARRDRHDLWWVWDVEIDDGMRGRGLGRAAMVAAEDYARAQGVARLGLNVFGGNAAAIALYDALGYAVDAQQMSKPLV
jgi:ribosomal protein S18 acetylase RimI-like enzyme